jgi:hypothetical protein
MTVTVDFRTFILFLLSIMKRNSTIQVKAAFLLLVFALNTVVGFACAVRTNMGATTHHHKHTEETTGKGGHEHANGSKHQHTNPEKKPAPAHIHADGKKHHHHQAIKNEENPAGKSGKDDCCNNGVIKFQNLDKKLSQNTRLVIDNPVFISLFQAFPGIDLFKPSGISQQKNKARYFHPPPPDIRIIIQSFQI